MPYPPGVNELPDDNADYWQDMAGILDTAARSTTPTDGLRIVVESDAYPRSPQHSLILTEIDARLTVPSYPDPSDAALEMAVKLGTFWTTVASDMLKARRK